MQGAHQLDLLSLTIIRIFAELNLFIYLFIQKRKLIQRGILLAKQKKKTKV